MKEILSNLKLDISTFEGADLTVTTPVDGATLATLALMKPSQVDPMVQRSVSAFEVWRNIPAPKRGEVVRCLGQVLREFKEPLSRLVTLECGKIISEGRGEVQEMIDICDYACGLSRMIGGLTLPSERPSHVMQENWHPLGPVGIITAFNFPVAVWAWNVALALVCGNSVIWKPSEKTPLTAIACQALFERACEQSGVGVPDHISQIIIGGRDCGMALVNHTRVPLISATGSCAMGKSVARDVADRFGKSLLELGGNNAAIITPSADLDVALPSIVFGAVGTAGQRCTSLRRLFVHSTLVDDVVARIKRSYESLTPRIGDPLDPNTLIGPLIDESSFDAMQLALRQAAQEGGKVSGGERIAREGVYVHPAIVELDTQSDIVKTETFAPILYIMPYETLDQVMDVHNDVPQGLSSAIFTTDLREAEYFKSRSDCGIANVNISTSGAEIGGAFGGEKETGGGRESGSDSWKAYMRRQTSTTYMGKEVPELAQGVEFK
tara:strand:+ start:1418 stop:2902 length:1485 start_codon:yes stop_codon:yes gene_type:complete